MAGELRELRVFMASPGDLQDERQALRGVERRLNALFRQRGVRVSIEGWEEVLPDAGAPQDLINPLVHDCDVFVGLLNMRWGTPTDNDSSGFSEEFNIALSRRVADGAMPAIGMYFREVDPDRLRDAGPQLRTVLEFKKRVEAERLVLHKTFGNADQLALEVMNLLTPHVMRLAEEATAANSGLDAGSSGSIPASDEPSSLESVDSDDDSGVSSAELDAAQRQVVSALEAFSSLFSGGPNIEADVRDRVSLSALAFAQDVGVLGSHLVNRLYRNRKSLELTIGEVNIWCRTYFEDFGSSEREARVVPMWGALSPGRFEGWFADVVKSLLLDEDENVVRGVVRFLTAHKLRPPALWDVEELEDRAREPQDYWVGIFQKLPGISEGLNYAVSVAGPSDAGLLAVVAEHEGLDERTGRLLRAYIRVLDGDTSQITELAPGRFETIPTPELISLVMTVIPGLSVDQCSSLVLRSVPELASAAAVDLLRRGASSVVRLKDMVDLESEIVERAMVDRAGQDPGWAEACVKELEDLGAYRWSNLIARLRAASMSRAELHAADEREELSTIAWTAMTIQDPRAHIDAAREVLSDSAAWLNGRILPLADKYPAVARHIVRTAKAAACEVLAVAAENTEWDLRVVAGELSEDYAGTRSLVLRSLTMMLSRMNPEACRQDLNLGDMKVLDGHWSSEEIEIILHSPLAEIAVSIWARSGIPELRRASQIWVLGQPEATDLSLEEALYAEDQRLRIVAIDELMARWNNEQLEDLLNRYDDRGRPWWYNVITAIDERLYGFRVGQA